MIVLDRISGLSGEHTVEQVWNSPVSTSAPQATRPAWRSECYGSRVATQQTVAQVRGELPVVLAAAIFPSGGNASVELTVDAEACIVQVAGITAIFPNTGEPSWSETA